MTVGDRFDRNKFNEKDNEEGVIHGHPVKQWKVGGIDDQGRPILGEVVFEMDETGKILIDNRSQEEKDDWFEKFGIPK